MPDSSEEVVRSVAEAESRLHDFIVARIPEGNAIAIFLSLIAKEPTVSIPTMCVASTRQGAVLYYNPKFVLSLSDPELMFVTAHEFTHLACDTFARSEVIREKYQLSTTAFNTKIAPYFDVVVNDMLKNMPGMRMLDESVGILHSGARQGVPEYLKNQRSLEAIASAIMKNYEETPALEIPEIPFANERSDAAESELESITNVLKQAIGSGGSTSGVPGDVSRLLSSSIAKASLSQMKRTKQLWSELTQSIRVTRANALARKRSMRRINRRTLLPPGRIFEKGFNVLFLLDESGSVDDTFLRFAFEIVSHGAIGDNADAIYVAHWDTQLGKLEKVTKGKKPDLKRICTGGTEFDKIYTTPELQRLDVDMCIAVTDGECYSWPKGRIPYPTVWLINEEHGYDNWKRLCNTGTAIYIPKESMK